MKIHFQGNPHHDRVHGLEPNSKFISEIHMTGAMTNTIKQILKISSKNEMKQECCISCS